MPFTFLSHQAPVLPLKLVRPSWFSGTALVLGSMAPDFEYFLRGEPVSTLSHTLLGQFVFCLPLTLALVLVVERLLAPSVPQHVPELGALRVGDYAALTAKRRGLGGWLVAAVSALLGSFSHIAWDGFTHGHGWAVALWPALTATAFSALGHDVPVYKVLQHGSTLGGAAVTLALLAVIGRRRLLRAWGGERTPNETPKTSRTALIVSTAIGLALGVALALVLGGRDDDALRTAVCIFLRATTGGFVGLCFGALLTTRAPRSA